MVHCLPLLHTAFAGAFMSMALSVQTAFASPEAHGDMSHGAHDGHGAEMAGAHGGHEAGGGGLPQLDASTFPSQLFWLAVAFGILYMIFSRRSLPEISGVLENRQNHIQSDLETAERLKSEAASAQQAYESGLQQARDSATSAMSDAHDKIKAKAEKQAEAFRAKTDEEVQKLEKNLQAAKESAMDDMNTIAAEIATEAAKKIVGIQTDPKQAKTVVESLNHGSTNAKAA